jgi:hypothetical protein
MEPELYLLTPRGVALRHLLVACVTIVACESRAPDGSHAALGARGGATAGAPGTGGSTGGTAGSGAAASGSGGSEDHAEVARALDGFAFRMTCGKATGDRLCETSSERPCPRHSDPSLSGVRLVDETLTLGGEATTLYDIDLSVEGIVEGKTYVGGEDQSQTSELPADGFYVGGEPAVGNAYNVYLLRVTDPPRDYFLNSVAAPDDARLRRSVFPVRYAARIRARGGTEVRLVLADPNCHATRNCKDPDDGACLPQALDFLADSWRTKLDTEGASFDGQFLGLTVTRVLPAP